MSSFFKSHQKERSDQELLEAYLATDDAVHLGTLYSRYIDLVYGICLKYLREEGRAQDAVMEIFEQLHRKVKEHDIKQFKSWLYVLSKNFCLMQLRKSGKDPSQNFDPAVMQSMDLWHHEKEEPREEEAHLAHCIEKLPTEQKQCIELFYLKGVSYKEIAALKAEEVGRIRSYIQNGRRNLKICLEKKKEAEQKSG